MTEQHDAEPSAGPGFTPPGLEETASRVRSVMAGQADRVDPSPDAYARLAQRVVTESDRSRRRPVWMSPTRAVVAGAAGLAVMVGGFAAVGGFEGSDRGGISIDAAETGQASPASEGGNPDEAGTADGADSGAGLSEETSSADASSGDGADETVGAQDEVSDESPSMVTGPVAATKTAAGQAFLDLIGVAPAEAIDVDTDGDGVGDKVIVRTLEEGGTEYVRQVAELDLVELADGSGWAVVGARSDSVEIEQPIRDQVVNSTIDIMGEGSGFEGWMEIDVLSSVDGSVLHLGGASGGSFESAPFSYEAEVLGTHQAWVVVRSSGGAENVALAFAAVGVAIDAAPDPTRFVVATVPLDDADGGLNLRSGPGVDSEKLGVVGWGQAVERTAGVTAERRGDDVWWPVTDDNGNEGWVNARFLAPANPLDGDELNTGGQQFLLTASSPEYVGSWFPVSERLGLTVFARGETVRLAASDLGQPSGWTSPVIDGSSLSELVSAPVALADEAVFRPNGQEYQNPAMEDVALRYFAGLPSVTATYPGSDGQAHTTHVFFENGPSGPRYVGVIIEASKG